MSPLAKEWLAKGLADLATAEREMRVRKKPNHDAVCFLSQLAVEKLLKAKLSMRSPQDSPGPQTS